MVQKDDNEILSSMGFILSNIQRRVVLEELGRGSTILNF